jgi:AcrR family transcriptional regulator
LSAPTETGTQRRPGRPATGAPERILEAGYEVMAREGYAGMTTAKIAAASGQNKSLIPYYFGSKQGLVAAVARRVAETITEEVLAGLGDPRTARELVQGLVAGISRVMDRDEGLLRVYFDLASQSVVDLEVGKILLELKEGYRAILRELVRALPSGPKPGHLDGIVVFLIAGLEGLSLERIERGETVALEQARGLFVESASRVISADSPE